MEKRNDYVDGFYELKRDNLNELCTLIKYKYNINPEDDSWNISFYSHNSEITKELINAKTRPFETAKHNAVTFLPLKTQDVEVMIRTLEKEGS